MKKYCSTLSVSLSLSSHAHSRNDIDDEEPGTRVVRHCMDAARLARDMLGGELLSLCVCAEYQC